MNNIEIANALNQYADFLENERENPYRIRAYRRAALAISRYSQDLSSLLQKGGDVTEIPYVGPGIAAQLKNLIEKGSLLIFKKEKKQPPINQLSQIKGIGLKKLKILKNLNITTKAALKTALKKGELNETPGFGPKIAKQIAANLVKPNKVGKKIKIYNAIPVVEYLLAYIKNIPGIEKVLYTGSYRRRKEVVGNINFIAVGKKIKLILDNFLSSDAIRYIVEVKNNSATVNLKFGLYVTLSLVPEKNYGAMLLYYTGSERHYEALQAIAINKQLTLKKQGLFKKEKYVAGKDEISIYHHLDLQFIEPEMRENRGEIELAHANKLPKLITISDIKGDLHSHTNETDGYETLEEMVNAAQRKGYEYVAITDHSKSLKITNGLDEKRLLKQIKAIDKLNEKLTNFTILKSTEVDILEDGSLDLSNDVLKELDLCVCSVHSKFKLPGKQQTERIIRAMDNPYFNILGHATGRLINHRMPYDIDIELIMQAAKERGCFMELNSQPARLDINDIYCQRAKELGVKISISSDAHTSNGFNFMLLGINQARRGWLEAKDVINTYSLVQLRKILKRK